MKKDIKNDVTKPEPTVISARCFACGFQNEITKKEHPYVFEIYMRQGAVICQGCGFKFSISEEQA